MRKIGYIVLLTLLTAVNSMAQEINWVTFEEALELQKKNPKKIMMDVYTNWCGPCKMLDKNTFHNPDVVKYVNDNFYAVKFNAEGNDVVKYMGTTYTNLNYNPALTNRRNGRHELTDALQVKAYPTIVYFDEEANVISPVSGYQKPQQIELYLKLFTSDKYKEMTSQDHFNEYYNAFVPEFKG